MTYLLSKLFLQPANLPPYPSTLPPVRPPTTQDPLNQPNFPHCPLAPPLTELQTQLYNTQSSLASNAKKVHTFKGVIAKDHAIKHEISLLRELVEKITTTMISGDSKNGWNCEEENEEEFSGASAEVDDDNLRSISL